MKKMRFAAGVMALAMLVTLCCPIVWATGEDGPEPATAEQLDRINDGISQSSVGARDATLIPQGSTLLRIPGFYHISPLNTLSSFYVGVGEEFLLTAGWIIERGGLNVPAADICYEWFRIPPVSVEYRPNKIFQQVNWPDSRLEYVGCANDAQIVLQVMEPVSGLEIFLDCSTPSHLGDGALNLHTEWPKMSLNVFAFNGNPVQPVMPGDTVALNAYWAQKTDDPISNAVKRIYTEGYKWVLTSAETAAGNKLTGLEAEAAAGILTQDPNDPLHATVQPNAPGTYVWECQMPDHPGLLPAKITVDVQDPQPPSSLSLQILDKDGVSYLTGLGFGATTSEVKRAPLFQGSSVSVLDAAGATVSDDAPVCTGYLVDVKQADKSSRNIAVVTGDVLGTGKLTIAQLTRMAAALSGREPLTEANLLAGCFGKTSTITIADLVAESKLLTSQSGAPTAPKVAIAGLQEAAYLYGDDYPWMLEQFEDEPTALVCSTVWGLTNLLHQRQGWDDEPGTLMSPGFPLSPEIQNALDSAVVEEYDRPGFTRESLESVIKLFVPSVDNFDWSRIHSLMTKEGVIYERGLYWCDDDYEFCPVVDVFYRAPEPFRPGYSRYGLETTSRELDAGLTHRYIFLDVIETQDSPLGFYLKEVTNQYAGTTLTPGTPWADQLPPLKPFPYDQF